MKYGVTFPAIDARPFVELAVEAEQAGWDGVFVWDLVYGVDAWLSLAAVAVRTERIRLGTMLTPPTRRRPWELASEVATLDHLSNGRAVLPIGLGAAGPEHVNSDFGKVGEETDRKIRAERTDEALEIITGLWRGEPYSFRGKHYTIKQATFAPKPIQQPRVPIWAVGAWRRPKSLARALRYDGIMPWEIRADGSSSPFNTDGTHINMPPAKIRELAAYIAANRTETTPFDIIIEGETPGTDHAAGAALIQPYADAGVTWWLENIWDTPNSEGGIEGMRTRIRQGPPR